MFVIFARCELFGYQWSVKVLTKTANIKFHGVNELSVIHHALSYNLVSQIRVLCGWM